MNGADHGNGRALLIGQTLPACPHPPPGSVRCVERQFKVVRDALLNALIQRLSESRTRLRGVKLDRFFRLGGSLGRHLMDAIHLAGRGQLLRGKVERPPTDPRHLLHLPQQGPILLKGRTARLVGGGGRSVELLSDTTSNEPHECNLMLRERLLARGGVHKTGRPV